MDLSPRVLGTTVAARLQTRATAVLLRIGRDTFTRADLARVACFNFQAAANLSAILTAELRVRDTREVFETVPPGQLALPRLGAVAVAVLGAAFEVKGLGGATPLRAWVEHHLAKDQRLVTFAALKSREAVERAAERKAARHRKHARRDEAHRVRVARFEARQRKVS